MSDEKAKKDRKGLAFALIMIIALFLAGRLFLFDIATVEGRSMLPTMSPGDLVFVWKAAYGIPNPLGGYFLLWTEPASRDVVAAVNPNTKALIMKRVTPLSPGFIADGYYYLLGDNFYESVDSREFGPVPMRNILGKVFRLPRHL